MKQFLRKNIFFLFCTFIFTALAILVLRYPLSYEGGDNYIHYKFARYAWQYPWLFLDHWGKPLFTILSSPFSQFGFVWAKSFNLLFGFGAALLTYLTVKKLGLKNEWLSIVFVCFSPIYFIMFNTTMTEILCSFLIILGIYLFVAQNFFWCALVISFLPLARSEGYLFIFFFIYLFIVQHRFKYIPYFFTGILLFSIIGKFYFYHDFFWLFTQNPYKDHASSIYGSGKLGHFVFNYRYLTGAGITMVILAGTFGLLFSTLKKNRLKGLFTDPLLILFLYPAISYTLIHSLLWWLGKLGSVGELRVITVIIPLFAVVALYGYNFIFSLTSSKKLLFYGFNLIMGCLIFMDAYKIYPLGYHLNGTEKVIKSATDWIKSNGYGQNMVYYYNPVVYILLDINPYDSLRIQEKVPDNNHPENGIKNGSLVIWDAHLGPNEGRLPLDNLLKNKYYKLLKLFRPEYPFKVLGGYEYEVYVFQRVSGYDFSGNISVLKLFDFENPSENSDSLYITDEMAFKGNYSFKLDNSKLYSPAFVPSVGDLRQAGVVSLTASGYLFPMFDPGENPTALVISFERDTSYKYFIKGLNSIPYRMNAWNQLSMSCQIPSEARDQDIVKIYFYQPGKKHIFLDDFKIETIKTFR